MNDKIIKFILVLLLIYAALPCVLLLFVFPPLALLIAGLLWFIYDKWTTKNGKDDIAIAMINDELDEIEADLDEHLAVDNSDGKVVRIETLKK